MNKTSFSPPEIAEVYSRASLYKMPVSPKFLPPLAFKNSVLTKPTFAWRAKSIDPVTRGTIYNESHLSKLVKPPVIYGNSRTDKATDNYRQR